MPKLIPASIIECPACDGKGFILLQFPAEFLGEEPRCETCRRCAGHGKVQQWVEVKIIGE